MVVVSLIFDPCRVMRFQAFLARHCFRIIGFHNHQIGSRCWVIQSVIETVGLKGSKLGHPKIFPLKQRCSNLLLREVSLGNYLNDDHSEIAVEVVTWLCEVAVYADGVFSFRIMSVLVYSHFCPLLFKFPHILALIALYAKT